LQLGDRNVAHMLCETPTMTEGIENLTVALAPEGVRQGSHDRRTGAQRAIPHGVDVIDV
jgi:hypothetical protein